MPERKTGNHRSIMGIRVVHLIAAFIASLAVTGTARAQQFDFPAAAAKDSAVLASYMPRLATQVLAAYREGDRRVYLDNLFRIQFVAGKYSEARSTLDSLRTLQGSSVQPEIRAANLLYSIVTSASGRSPSNQLSDALRQEFVAATRGLDDRSSAFLMRALSFSRRTYEGPFNGAIQRQGTKT